MSLSGPQLPGAGRAAEVSGHTEAKGKRSQAPSLSQPLSIVGRLRVSARFRLGVFLGATALFCALMFAAFRTAGAPLAGPQHRFLLFAYTLPPALLALTLHGGIGGRSLTRELGLGLGRMRRYPLLPVIALGVALLHLLCAGLLGADLALSREALASRAIETFGPDEAASYVAFVQDFWMHPLVFEVLIGLAVGSVWGSVLFLPQELFLRGFLLAYVPGGLWRKSLGVTVLQVLWMLPLLALGLGRGAVADGGHATSGFLLTIAGTALLAVYVRVVWRSVFASALFLGAYSALWPALARALPAATPGPWQYGAEGLGGLVVLGCALILLRRLSKRLKAPPTSEDIADAEARA